MAIENIKIMLLKGEKGATGEKGADATDEQIEEQVGNWIAAYPTTFKNLVEDKTLEETQKYLNDHPELIENALNAFDGLGDCDGGYAFSDLGDYTNDFNGGYPNS